MQGVVRDGVTQTTFCRHWLMVITAIQHNEVALVVFAFII
jgi:hypothetical protein